MGDLSTIRDETLAAIGGAGDLRALDAVRVAALGKSGRVTGQMKTLGTLARGYAVARDDAGRTLGSVGRFAPGAPFTLLLRDGRVAATARTLHPDGPGAAASDTGTAA